DRVRHRRGDRGPRPREDPARTDRVHGVRHRAVPDARSLRPGRAMGRALGMDLRRGDREHGRHRLARRLGRARAALAMTGRFEGVGTIDDVVDRFERSTPPPGDEKRHFHGVYHRNTVAVKDDLETGGFLDPEWLEPWDVIFANLY